LFSGLFAAGPIRRHQDVLAGDEPLRCLGLPSLSVAILPAGSSMLISPPALVLLCATCKVRHGAVRVQGVRRL
jgi:hypothetical protein